MHGPGERGETHRVHRRAASGIVVRQPRAVQARAAEPGGILPVSGAIATGLTDRYNRVVNTAVSVAPVTIESG